MTATKAILIHSSLVVLCNDYTDEIVDEVLTENRIAFDAIRALRINSWEKHKRFNGLFFEKMVENSTRHERLDKCDFFAITSDTDPAYANPRAPAGVTRYCQSIGNYRLFHLGRQRECCYGNRIGHYSYLALPYPMRDGCSYTFAQDDGRSVTLAYPSVSRAIKVNQAGYSPAIGRRYAYLGAWVPALGPVDFDQYVGQRFEVIDSVSGQVTYRGVIAPAWKDPHYVTKSAAGEHVYRLDLSAAPGTGEFYINILGVGRSFTFKLSSQAYGEAFYTHLRGLYHLRAGQELKPEFTGWPRPLAHTKAGRLDYAVESVGNKPPVDAFAAIRYQSLVNFDASHDITDAPGGWYDASDYDRRWFHYKAVYDLLLAYEIAPKNFTDGQAHTHEAGDGIPDILKEVAWGLLVWRNGQDPVTGGVPGHVEAIQHPDSRDQTPDGRPHNDRMTYYYSAWTRSSSLLYAAAATHLSRLLSAFDEVAAAGWFVSALKAYEFGRNPANHYYRENYCGSGKPFGESVTTALVDRCLAELELWKATGDPDYRTSAVGLYPNMLRALESSYSAVRMKDMYRFWWAFYEADPAITASMKAGYKVMAEYALNQLNQPFYAVPLTLTGEKFPPSWGKANGMEGATVLVLAWALHKDQRYLDGAALCCDWQHGCNPLGISWTTGIGAVYPTNCMHGEAEEDDVDDPVPGITVYGISGGVGITNKMEGWSHAWINGKTWVICRKMLPDYIPVADDGAPQLPYFRAFSPDFHNDVVQNEFTVWETISPSVLVTGVLMGEGWMPSEDLKNRKPNPEVEKWMLP